MVQDRSCSSRLLALCGVVAVSWACTGTTDVNPASRLRLTTVAGDSVVDVQADGYSRVTLVAELDENAADDKRTVVFTTTRGALFTSSAGAAAGVTQAEVVIDGTGRAYIDLQSSATVGEARVQATVKNAPAVNRTLQVRFAPIVPDSVARFDTLNVSVDADGFSRIPIAVRVASALPAGQRTVTFQTTAGTFVSGTVGEAQTRSEVIADASNVATVLFRAPAQAGTALIRATVSGVTRELRVALRPVHPDSILRVGAELRRADADGASVSTIAVWISPRVPAADRTARVQITAGTLLAGASIGSTTAELSVGQQDSVRIDVRSPNTAGMGRLRVSVGAFTKEVPISFQAALPDTILVDPGKFSMAPADEATVTARLIRSVGTVTQNTFVNFTAVDSLGRTVGLFRATTPTDQNGVATAIFSAPGVTTRMIVELRASLRDGSKTGVASVVVLPKVEPPTGGGAAEPRAAHVGVVRRNRTGR